MTTMKETSPLLSSSSLPPPAKPSSQLIDLYDDKTISSGKSNEPLLQVYNKDAPQVGIHLYQFPASFYSCEVRLLLEEKKVCYTEHDICIVAGEFDQYKPDYVKINPRCVVPSLVQDGGKVTTDAHTIIQNCDEMFPNGPTLYPKEDNPSVKEQFDLACSVFVEALTYGEVNGGPKLPPSYRPMLKKNHNLKLKELTTKLEEYKNDPYLKECYEGKLRVLKKQIEVLGDETNLEDVVEATKLIFDQLNKQLIEGPIATKANSWICGSDYTIADMQWGLVLVRLEMRGYADMLWGDKYPAVDAYYKKLIARPTIQHAVIKYQQKHVITKLIMKRKIERHGKKIVVFGMAILGLLGYAAYTVF